MAETDPQIECSLLSLKFAQVEHTFSYLTSFYILHPCTPAMNNAYISIQAWQREMDQALNASGTLRAAMLQEDLISLGLTPENFLMNMPGLLTSLLHSVLIWE